MTIPVPANWPTVIAAIIRAGHTPLIIPAQPPPPPPPPT